MAANQPNSKLYTYIDDNGTSWALRGPIDTAINAIDGSAAFVGGDPVWLNSKKRVARHCIFQDPTTFRIKRFPVFTATAFAAITGTSTLAVSVPGETTTVTYNLSQKVGERQPIAKASRNLIDHA